LLYSFLCILAFSVIILLSLPLNLSFPLAFLMYYTDFGAQPSTL
jgi:hypothetical protein